jgi:phospholipid-binding lipoprotein MlaA
MMRLLGTAVLCAALCGCASTPSEIRVEHDPWEPLNRSLFRLNEAVDKVSLKPIARGYRKVIPSPVRQGVTNFSRNLLMPTSSLNSFLQGKPAQGVNLLGRFVINSTFGIGGIFDVASKRGLEGRIEDFGQTAAVWGVPDGPFVMIPFLGPQTLRDAVLLPLTIVTDPLYHYDVSSVRDRVYFLRLINLRANVLPLEDLMKDSKDRYVTLRETYLQNRRFEIYDGDPPVEDDFYDEFLEEEDY